MSTLNRLERQLSQFGPLEALWLASRPYMAQDGKSWTSTNGKYTWGTTDAAPTPNTWSALGRKGKYQLNTPNFDWTFMTANQNTAKILSGAPGLTFVGVFSNLDGQAMVGFAKQFGSPEQARFQVFRDKLELAYNDSDATDSVMFTNTGAAQILVVSVDIPNTTVRVYKNKTLLTTDTTAGVSGRTSFSNTDSQGSRLGTLNWTPVCEYYAMAFIHRTLDDEACQTLSDVVNQYFAGDFY